MNQKGFILLYIVLGIILVVGIVGASYYLGSLKNRPQSQIKNSGNLKNAINQLSPSNVPNNQTYKVVFTKSGDLWIVNYGGTDSKQLTHYGANFNPQLSPKGDYIAYYSVDETAKQSVLNQTSEYDDTKVDLWSMKVDGTNPVKLTGSNISVHRSSLAWSPLGNQLLYLEDGKIIIINYDGTNRKVVTDLNSISDLVELYPYIPTAIWSPDGTKIMVTAFAKKDIFPHESNDYFTQILLYNLNGSLITRNSDSIFNLSYWAPNNKLYFVDGTNGIGGYGLESINLDGTNKTLIAGASTDMMFNNKGTNNLPSEITQSAIYGSAGSIYVSKDGKMIATNRHEWFFEKKTTSPLWIMNIDGSGSHPVNLPDEVLNALASTPKKTVGGSIANIKWLPDNEHLIFSIQNGGFDAADGLNSDQYTLYSIKIDGSDLKILDSTHAVINKPPYIIKDDEISTGVESLY